MQKKKFLNFFCSEHFCKILSEKLLIDQKFCFFLSFLVKEKYYVYAANFGQERGMLPGKLVFISKHKIDVSFIRNFCVLINYEQSQKGQRLKMTLYQKWQRIKKSVSLLIKCSIHYSSHKIYNN